MNREDCCRPEEAGAQWETRTGLFPRMASILMQVLHVDALLRLGCPLHPDPLGVSCALPERERVPSRFSTLPVDYSLKTYVTYYFHFIIFNKATKNGRYKTNS